MLRGAGVEGAAEDAGEGEHVVDLVRVVGATGGHDPHVGGGVLGHHLGGRVGHREDDRVVVHLRQRLRLDDARAGEADEDVHALDHVVGLPLTFSGFEFSAYQRLASFISPRRSPRARSRALPLRSQPTDLGDPGGEHHLRHRYPGGAEANHQHPQLLDRLAGDLQRVEERRHRHHRGAVLVVVEDGDVERLLQPVLDLEAARGGDVLEVDAAEGRRHQLDRLDDLVGVLGVEADREGVDAGELFEEHALALHHRHRRLRADVAEPEHGAAVETPRPCFS